MLGCRKKLAIGENVCEQPPIVETPLCLRYVCEHGTEITGECLREVSVTNLCLPGYDLEEHPPIFAISFNATDVEIFWGHVLDECNVERMPWLEFIRRVLCSGRDL